jgi:glycosyltransferase involved in cell wall biosynthesis
MSHPRPPNPLRRLLFARDGTEDRIFYHNIWFRGHNNPRYSELLPRLRRLDLYLAVCSDRRVVRGVQFRVLRVTRRIRYRLLFGLANRRYRWMFTTANEQIPHFQGRVVADVDDPTFTSREVGLLSHQNVAAYVVTDERAGKRFQELGVAAPYHVIPQGVSLGSLSREKVSAIAARHRLPDERVVGYVASWLLADEDRGGGDPMYNVEHLLALWESIRARVPNARLWLIGETGPRIRRRIAGRPDILAFGRLPKADVLSYVANFHVALYPRAKDQGIQAAKVAEYLGAGVPTVSYDLRVTEILRTTGAGVMVRTPGEFVDAVEQILRDESSRQQLATSARRAGETLDWDRLARRYEEQILDRYLA